MLVPLPFVYDMRAREKEAGRDFIHPSCNVGILEIEEEFFIESMDLQENLRPEEHEAAGRIFHAEDVVISRIVHFKPVLPFPEGLFEEKANEEVRKSRIVLA